MRFSPASLAATTLLFLGYAAAADFNVAFNFEDGSSSDRFLVPDGASVAAIDSGETVHSVWLAAPGGARVGARCTFLGADRQTVGVYEFSQMAIRDVEPPAVVAFVQCNTI